MQNILSFVTDFKAELNRQCFGFDGTWIKRARKFNTHLMVESIVYLLAQKSTCLKSLANQMAINNENYDLNYAASSFCDARKKMPPYIFVDLSQWIYNFIEKNLSRGMWFGRPIFAIDSTSITLPRELMSEGFGHPDTGEFYPQATLTALYDLRLGMFYDSILSQHRSERTNALQLFKSVPESGLVIADRGFFSFELLQEAVKNKIDILFRVAFASAPEEIRELAEMPFKDIVTTITPSIPTQRKLLKHGYSIDPIEVRILRKEIAGTEFILITTVTDSIINRNDFFKLYECRWDIESGFRHLKSELKLESFKSKHLNGILQEIFATIFLANFSAALVRLRKGSKTKAKVRVEVSSLAVIRFVRDSFLVLISAGNKRIRLICQHLEKCIDKAHSSFRPGRSYPRTFWQNINPWTKYAKGIRC